MQGGMELLSRINDLAGRLGIPFAEAAAILRDGAQYNMVIKTLPARSALGADCHARVRRDDFAQAVQLP